MLSKILLSLFLPLFLFFSLSLVIPRIEASEKLGKSSYTDLKSSLSLLFEASLTQFQTKSNFYYLAVGVPVTTYIFSEDDRLSDHSRKKSIPGYMRVIGDMGISLSFPVIPLSMYYFGKYNHNNKAMQFALEYASAVYLSLAESGIFSYISIHERPNTEGQSFWETAFRGNSSFPSGHVIPYYMLFFKTFQFYGPYASLLPAGLSYIAAQQRVREGRHFPSDVVASFFFAAFASEGVRKAAAYDQNHPIYKMIFEHHATLGIIRNGRAIGPKIVWDY